MEAVNCWFAAVSTCEQNQSLGDFERKSSSSEVRQFVIKNLSRDCGNILRKSKTCSIKSRVSDLVPIDEKWAPLRRKGPNSVVFEQICIEFELLTNFPKQKRSLKHFDFFRWRHFDHNDLIENINLLGNFIFAKIDTQKQFLRNLIPVFSESVNIVVLNKIQISIQLRLKRAIKNYFPSPFDLGQSLVFHERLGQPDFVTAFIRDGRNSQALD